MRPQEGLEKLQKHEKRSRHGKGDSEVVPMQWPKSEEFACERPQKCQSQHPGYAEENDLESTVRNRERSPERRTETAGYQDKRYGCGDQREKCKRPRFVFRHPPPKGHNKYRSDEGERDHPLRQTPEHEAP